MTDYLAVLAGVLIIWSSWVDCPDNEKHLRNRVCFYWNIGILWYFLLRFKHWTSKRGYTYTYSKEWFNKYGNGAFYRYFKESVRF